MTNANLVKPAAARAAGSEPSERLRVQVPATEGAAAPTTDRDPIDSPGPNASAKKDPPAPGELGLSTRR